MDAADAARVQSPLANLTVAAGVAGVCAAVGWALTRLVPPEGTEAPQGRPAARARRARARRLDPRHRIPAAHRPRGARPRHDPGRPAPRALAGRAARPPRTRRRRPRARPRPDQGHRRPARPHRPALVRLLAPRPRPARRGRRRRRPEISALGDFGGWGYRVRAHRTGVVVRSGEALVVRRTGGREFAVTVPDARTAAALLNTLAERHGKV
ncbi:hypothetical protein O1L60_18300 [Streptomyces diastatochromogenes]|nr:hypothetical protein [Streptomyces diastatochromogenes]